MIIRVHPSNRIFSLYTAQSIAAIVRGNLSGHSALEIHYLSVDSRKISFPDATAFFALKTGTRDGHSFIADAYEQGVRCFVISEAVVTGAFTGAGFIMVPNSLVALQQLAGFHRSQFEIPVIGITGSNGKTIVKEWLNLLLQHENKVVRSPKSYNSQIGVPLSVWQISAVHTIGIFEAGISKPGEMTALEKIIQPTIGILTNLGAAHDEGFEDRKQKLEEKLQLFIRSDILICCFDNELIRRVVKQRQLKRFAWGRSADCELQLLDIEKGADSATLTMNFAGATHIFHIGFTDDASIENAMHCIATLLYAKVEAADISHRLARLHPVEMRLEWKKAINNCYLLNDSYSNDLSSLIIALNYLEQQEKGTTRTVILSDFFESGLADDALYAKVSLLLQQHQVKKLFIVGSHIRPYQQLFEAGGMIVRSYPGTEAFIAAFEMLEFSNETILLKGARRFGFERIALLLEQQVHQTVLEINLTSLAFNLQQYRQFLKPGIKMMVMVKAFGYGSGDAEIARVLQYNKVDYLAVAYADEGVALRKAGIHLPIMVMNPEPATFDAIENNNLEPEIYSFPILEAFEKYCLSQGITQYPVHIKLDTGMHRLGFEINEIGQLAERLNTQKVLVAKTVFTHFAASENPELDEFTRLQATRFTECCDMLEDKLGYAFTRHADNTAGIRRHPGQHFDMVRLGIGLYGVDDNTSSLRVVSTLKTTVAQVKKIAAGETVGYGRKGKVDRESVIATVRIGYADGYRRILGNGNGIMWLRGKPAPVIGNVSMDMTMIDVTGIDGVQAGDNVEVFGSNIPVQELAKQCSTIPYEIMTGISQRVKRVYIEE